MANDFPQPALDAISDHGVSNLPSDRKSHTSLNVFAGRKQDQQAGKANSLTPSLDPLNIPSLPQSMTTGKSQRTALATLGGNRGNQALTSLCPTTLNDVPTACSLHPSPKTVGPLTLNVAWLVCALHLNLQAATSNRPIASLIFRYRGGPKIYGPRRLEPDVYAVLYPRARSRSDFFTSLARARRGDHRKVPRGTAVKNPRDNHY